MSNSNIDEYATDVTGINLDLEFSLSQIIFLCLTNAKSWLDNSW